MTNEEKTMMAHEVAMTAAQAAARVQQHPSDNIGAGVAQAYLQAYEAVEGWTKPEPEVDIYRERCVPHVSLSHGQSVDLFNSDEKKYMRVTLRNDGAWDWDAGVVGGSRQPKEA